jgi:hypothetical protein
LRQLSRPSEWCDNRDKTLGRKAWRLNDETICKIRQSVPSQMEAYRRSEDRHRHSLSEQCVGQLGEQHGGHSDRLASIVQSSSPIVDRTRELSWSSAGSLSKSVSLPQLVDTYRRLLQATRGCTKLKPDEILLLIGFLCSKLIVNSQSTTSFSDFCTSASECVCKAQNFSNDKTLHNCSRFYTIWGGIRFN